MQDYIKTRHKLTKLERLELRYLLKRTILAQRIKISKQSSVAWLECYEREKLLFRNIPQTLLELKEDKIAKSLLNNDNIALNEVFELKKEPDANVIKSFFKRYNKDKINDKIFDKTFHISKKFETKVSFVARRGKAGCYRGGIKLINIFLNGAKRFKTYILLHELIHSVSSSAFNYLYMVDFIETENYGRKGILLTDAQIQPLKEINELYKTLKEREKFDDYGFLSVAEFLAELANPTFRKVLRKQGVLKVVLEKYDEFLKNCDI